METDPVPLGIIGILCLVIFAVQLGPQLRIAYLNKRLINGIYASKELFERSPEALTAAKDRFGFQLTTINTDKSLATIKELLQDRLESTYSVSIIGLSDSNDELMILYATLVSFALFLGRGSAYSVPVIYSGMIMFRKSSDHVLTLCAEDFPCDRDHDRLLDELCRKIDIVIS